MTSGKTLDRKTARAIHLPRTKIISKLFLGDGEKGRPYVAYRTYPAWRRAYALKCPAGFVAFTDKPPGNSCSSPQPYVHGGPSWEIS
jgi:hypothetical protein